MKIFIEDDLAGVEFPDADLRFAIATPPNFTALSIE
jgi:hypothetical protein